MGGGGTEGGRWVVGGPAIGGPWVSVGDWFGKGEPIAPRLPAAGVARRDGFMKSSGRSFHAGRFVAVV